MTMNVVEVIGVSYSDIEACLDRKFAIEMQVDHYLAQNPHVADRYESEISLSKYRCYLKINLIKDGTDD